MSATPSELIFLAKAGHISTTASLSAFACGKQNLGFLFAGVAAAAYLSRVLESPTTDRVLDKLINGGLPEISNPPPAP